jgi:DNA-binding response OmpR family regulator
MTNVSADRRVLVVEDDASIAMALRDGFVGDGYQVEIAADGARGLERALADRPDLVILDLMLPRLGGLDLCRELRSRGRRTPVIMLTARGQEIDRVLGLKLGADDYVTKPFSLIELLARAEAVLRRTTAPAVVESQAPSTLRFGDVEVDFARHQVRKAGAPLRLTPRELKLLEYFASRHGEVVSREELLDKVWGYRSNLFTRTVDTHVAKLRKKVEDRAGDPKHLLTVHRVGYRFVAEP